MAINERGGFAPPKSGGIRDITSNSKTNGRIINPVRYPQIGGLTGPGKIPKGDVNLSIDKGGRK